jgi:hypothetical protein
VAVVAAIIGSLKTASDAMTCVRWSFHSILPHILTSSLASTALALTFATLSLSLSFPLTASLGFA